MLITIASCFAIVTLVMIVRYGVPSDHAVTKKTVHLRQVSGFSV